MTSAAARRERPLSREAVVAAALRLVEREGVASLTMRRLADEVGAAVTAIYWHVGNRDALLDELVARVLDEIGELQPHGRSRRARIASLLRDLRERLLAHPHLVGLAHERALTTAMFQPVQAALARELAALGLRGAAAALAVQALQSHVVASVVLQRTTERGPVHRSTDPAVWPDVPDDPELVAALARPVDFTAVFEHGLSALLAALPEG